MRWSLINPISQTSSNEGFDKAILFAGGVIISGVLPEIYRAIRELHFQFSDLKDLFRWTFTSQFYSCVCKSIYSKEIVEAKCLILQEVIEAAKALSEDGEKLGYVISKGTQLDILHTNSVFRELLEWPQGGDKQPRSIHDILPLEIRNYHRAWVERVKKTGALPGSLMHPLRNITLRKCTGKPLHVNLVLRTLGYDVDLRAEDCVVYAILTSTGALDDDSSDVRNDDENGIWSLAAEGMYGSNAGQMVASGQVPDPEAYPLATVLCLDIVGYTKRCTGMSPKQIADWMSQVHADVEQLLSKHYIRKIETRGDCYVCVSGTNTVDGDRDQNQMSRMVAFALDVAVALEVNHDTQIRVGIDIGPLTITYINSNHYAPTMCAFGDPMVVAGKLEQSGSPGMIKLSEVAALYLTDEHDSLVVVDHENNSVDFSIEPSWETLFVKGVGDIKSAWIDCKTRKFVSFGKQELNPDTKSEASVASGTSERDLLSSANTPDEFKIDNHRISPNSSEDFSSLLNPSNQNEASFELVSLTSTDNSY